MAQTTECLGLHGVEAVHLANVGTRYERFFAVAREDGYQVMAGALGESAVASTFATRANHWQNVFNPATGLFTPKLRDGSFVPGFSPGSADVATSSTSTIQAGTLITEVSKELSGAVLTLK